MKTIEKEKNLLLQLLNLDEHKINYYLKNNNVSHTATGVVDLSLLLYVCVQSGLTDVQIIYNTTTDVVSFVPYLRSVKEIDFDRYEIINKDLIYFVTDTELDRNFKITSKYLTPENSIQIEKKLNIYKDSISLLTKGFKNNEYYYPVKGKITFFVNEVNELDFNINIQFNHKLNDYVALEQIDKIIKNKEHFKAEQFSNFLSSFEMMFIDYFKKNDFLVDVKISCVDDLLNYRNLMGMVKI